MRMPIDHCAVTLDAEDRADALSVVLGLYIPVDRDADFARVHFADLERLAEELVALRAQAQGRKA